jgi:hypothetical protein
MAVTPGNTSPALNSRQRSLYGVTCSRPAWKKVPFLAIGPFRHLGVVEPMHRFALVHDEFGIRKIALARGPVGQARRVVRVHMRQDHRVDARRVNARGSDVSQDLAGRGQQVVARSGVDQRQPPRGVDQKCIHRRPARRAERRSQNAGGFFHADVAQNLHRAIEKSVADGGDDDVAHAAVIDAGNLLLRNIDHGSIARRQSVFLMDGL